MDSGLCLPAGANVILNMTMLGGTETETEVGFRLYRLCHQSCWSSMFLNFFLINWMVTLWTIISLVTHSQILFFIFFQSSNQNILPMLLWPSDLCQWSARHDHHRPHCSVFCLKLLARNVVTIFMIYCSVLFLQVNEVAEKSTHKIRNKSNKLTPNHVSRSCIHQSAC